jgi:hypothetical protein
VKVAPWAKGQATDDGEIGDAANAVGDTPPVLAAEVFVDGEPGQFDLNAARGEVAE